MYDNPFRVPDKPFQNWKQFLKNSDNNMTGTDVNIFNYFFQMIVNYYLNRYVYRNLPEEIPPIMIERALLFEGNALFIKESDMFGVTSVSLGGNLDIYGIPENRYAYTCTYFNKMYNKDNSVIIWARPLSIPEILPITVHCESLTNLRVSRDINIIQQRTPCFVAGEQSAKVDSNNLIQKFLRGIPFIKINKASLRNQTIPTFEPIQLGIQPIFDKLDDAIERELAQCLAEGGIYMTTNTKRERLTSDENFQNSGLIESSRKNGLDCRRRAVNQINKLFGLNIEVEFNSDIEIVESPLSENGGDELDNAVL